MPEIDLGCLSYDDWLVTTFGQPDPANPWWFNSDCAWGDTNPGATLNHCIRLFRDPWPLMERFSREQIATGLRSLISAVGPKTLGHVFNPAVNRRERLDAVAAVTDLFSRLFARACSQNVPPIQIPDPLDYACLMWWDTFSVGRPVAGESDEQIDGAIILTLRDILAIRSEACQRSALVGLFFWSLKGKEWATEAFDVANQFFQSDRAAAEDVQRWADAVRSGKYPLGA